MATLRPTVSFFEDEDPDICALLEPLGRYERARLIRALVRDGMLYRMGTTAEAKADPKAALRVISAPPRKDKPAKAKEHRDDVPHVPTLDGLPDFDDIATFKFGGASS